MTVPTLSLPGVKLESRPGQDFLRGDVFAN